MLTYISDKDIAMLGIASSQAMRWVKEAFLLKPSALLPHKTSIAYENNKFINTMPVVVPELNAMAVKIIKRYPGRRPAIDGHIFYYNYTTGELTHILDAALITALRTGAVCATAVKTFALPDFSTLALMGLGETAKRSMICLLEDTTDRHLHIKLLNYKDHCQRFLPLLTAYPHVSVEICETVKSLVQHADIVISCITYAADMLSDPAWFKPGCVLVPVHTRGFQNCDLVFDKIFADDTAHVAHFTHFSRYKHFGEIADVLSGKNAGRENSQERIISYNVGIALHDIVFSRHIIEMLTRPRRT